MKGQGLGVCCSSSERSIRGNGINKGLLGYSPTAPHIYSQSGVVSNRDTSNLTFLVLSIISLGLTLASLSKLSPFLEAIKPFCRPLCGTLSHSLMQLQIQCREPSSCLIVQFCPAIPWTYCLLIVSWVLCPINCSLICSFNLHTLDRYYILIFHFWHNSFFPISRVKYEQALAFLYTFKGDTS